VKIRIAAAGADPKQVAAFAGVRPLHGGRAIKITIAALHKRGERLPAIEEGGAAKGIKIRVLAAGTNPKNGADPCRPAELGRPVEMAVASLDKSGIGPVPIGRAGTEEVEIRNYLCPGPERQTPEQNR
jgi:hypothetical protein